MLAEKSYRDRMIEMGDQLNEWNQQNALNTELRSVKNDKVHWKYIAEKQRPKKEESNASKISKV